MTNLKQLGWIDFFENQFQQYKQQGFTLGRIASENKNNYNIFTESGEVLGEVSGKLMYTSDSMAQLPKTGDWVVISIYDEDKAIIHDVLERRTKLSRKSADKKTDEQIIAANIDIAFIMQSLDNNFNINRMQRYIVAVNESGAVPVILLSKSDQCDDVESKQRKVKEVFSNIDNVVISSVTKTGLNTVIQYFEENKTAVFIGSSGVGKSTLINTLIGEELLKTSEISASVGKGKHTTTRREMILLPSGGILIDTPGMREFALWNSNKGFANTFSEFDELAKECHFSDCTHIHETQCAVLEALQNGIISKVNYDNYLKLRKELQYLESKQNTFAQLEEKRKWKIISKEIKRLYKGKG